MAGAHKLLNIQSKYKYKYKYKYNTYSTYSTYPFISESDSKQSLHLMSDSDVHSNANDSNDSNDANVDHDDSSIMSLEMGCGDIVVLQDMISPELNGKVARVKHESDREGQWLVQLHETGKKLVVDSENLFMAAFH
ncbi:MAG: hypothetical protein SGBAC_008328 [Bacillariaceae sp.]